jgi:molybdopterin biosynthesis enzyme
VAEVQDPMKVPIADAEPGRILAQAVQNHQGQTLLKAGTEIQPKHLRILRTWGVESIEIEEPRAAVAPATGEEREQRVVARFRHAGDDPILAELLDAVLERVRGDA